MCAKFQQKLLKSMVVGARQSFQFFRQNTWFLKNNRALSKFLYGILYYLIIIVVGLQSQLVQHVHSLWIQRTQ